MTRTATVSVALPKSSFRQIHLGVPTLRAGTHFCFADRGSFDALYLMQTVWGAALDQSMFPGGSGLLRCPKNGSHIDSCVRDFLFRRRSAGDDGFAYATVLSGVLLG